MPAVERFTHEFVEFIPSEIQEGVLYISLPYTTTIHLCACGCHTKVVCPLSPTDYAMVFDGQSVGISPSIGNWNFHCQSHYFIRRGRVVWAAAMSQTAIAAGRQRNRAVKQAEEQGSSAHEHLVWASENGSVTEHPADSGPQDPGWRRFIRAISKLIR
ncbi:DUF6527 family protein [Mycolicibacterium sphagni]|uniref:Uncharacterized protein n=1 Tax=Mycolicibacterium sphagni TaxID=1786 RepID=A0A255DGZ7_9MYCO|nr:DUF6527 family protein [Mycolicibacterium sphagni]OYN76232.1 hypothetical protein CG716_23100 [Mycolicibacterium sphagni]